MRIREVGPRDGLQNESVQLSVEEKLAWIHQLEEAGLSYIEVSSFVHPKWIPQLADADEVFKKLSRKPGIIYAALVPNERGLERALAAQVDEVSIFLSASEAHNQKNLNHSISETIASQERVIQKATEAGKSVRAYISTAFFCPYAGKTPITDVLKLIERFAKAGVREISIGDTVGQATPNHVEELFKRALAEVPARLLAFHPHDTRGTALANAYAAYMCGITAFDGATGGLGGCPYAPGAAGNVATEDLVYLFEGMNVATGINQEKLAQAATYIEAKVKRALPSHTLRTMPGEEVRG
ncbi:hydroxymethylglutaryl-CoA lyase [Shouchella shacheensis]|uniref:hydroxymethylglutaryl-CoA lyase n=1 Tax=Shouchella shacheensis TaxID=1649580 RepID=UPI00074047DF|nr:hydroxymethylglutaryl-CoA lyase [Shouchella shacheensis]